LSVYEIRVKGHLEDRWSEWFDGLEITNLENGEAVLSGDIVDQAALHGLLIRVRDLGLPLVGVRRLYPLADGIAAVSAGVADDLALQIRVRREAITVIYNPTVTADFAARCREAVPDEYVADRRPVILYAGRLAPEKRLDLLIEAFCRVRSECTSHPGPCWSLQARLRAVSSKEGGGSSPLSRTT
jgi:glycosyltransferase involved in cell wall biosynthesis